MSATTRNQVFTAVHTVGGLLPADMLVRISEGKVTKDLKGLAPADYRIPGSRSVRDEAERHWDNLKSLWRELREKLPAAPEASVPPDSTGYAQANWVEPLFETLGFGHLTAVDATGIAADDGTKTFPVSHRRDDTLVHVTPWNTPLNKYQGAGSPAPQSLLQEALNRTDAHLWALLTNGRQLRLLRDSNALATASYVEFDLEAIFDGELFSEFVIVYRLLHASRFEARDGGTQWTCWLEVWRDAALRLGARFLDDIGEGVRLAITELGTGFLRHPANTALRENFDRHSYHAALLRLVYRLLFVFVAEDRDALHPPSATLEARNRYAKYFSTARLREQSRRRRGTSHADRWEALRLVLSALGDEAGRPELGLPGLGGLFDATEADEPLRGLTLTNEHLMAAIRHLAVVRDTEAKRWRTVDYRTLDAEELGAIYESLLALVPEYSATERTFELAIRAGNERKKTGSYYTPSPLVDVLLDSTLDPVIDEAQRRGERAAAEAGRSDAREDIVFELLSLTVCDPACGSGHFLVAAARRIAKRVAAVRERTPEPPPEKVRHALHEVIARCVYGVDLNPMAVELAKVSLWMEALEPGKALGFLDAHVKLGNGLIGATPALLRGGIPEQAFKVVEGDDKSVANDWLKRNKLEHEGVYMLDAALDEQVSVSNDTFAAELRDVVGKDDDPTARLGRVRALAERYRTWQESPAYLNALHIADAWCAAFMWEKTEDAPAPVTQRVFLSLQNAESEGALQETHQEIVRLSREYRFFHWHLEFPDVFSVPDHPSAAVGVDPVTGWAGGFDCVLGNPPWDKVDFEDKKYFSVVEPSLAEIAGTKRRTAIAKWASEHPEEGARYQEARRRVKSSFLFLGSSGAYPQLRKGLSIKGVNSLQTDQLFTERFVSITAPEGRCGTVVPTQIATGAGAQFLFQDLTQRGAVKHLYDFENGRREKLFPAVDSRYSFSLISLVGRDLTEPAARFAFFLGHPDELADGKTVFALSPEEIALINPNTGTLPVFRRRRDADLTVAIQRRIPVLVAEGRVGGDPWNITFKNFFNVTDDSDLFRDLGRLEAAGWELEGNVFVRDGERMLPLYEGKMAHIFDHRWNRYYDLGNDDYERVPLEDKEDAHGVTLPRQWIKESGRIPTVRKGKEVTIAGVDLRLEELEWERDWLLGWRDVARTTDERTAIPALLPKVAVGHTFPLMFPKVSVKLAAAMVAAQSSLVFDFVARQKVGGIHMALMTWKQLPVPHPDDLARHTRFLTPRTLELVYCAWDMEPLARNLDDTGAPFIWNEDRRAQLRAELDAYFLHLYGVNREDADYILESFQTENGGLKNNEIAKYGEYRTKRLVLTEYDRMATAGLTMENPLVDGETYTSTLTPPPGNGPRHPA
ncbi:Eco57I restriction-modification methylase domain-containing protein [Streptomyces sp. MA5143a]|uniref:Eco57I restriction-modification methylase domain-containing protein n=1 Tax=Streptomyces sp. MA5143a TaxID=2083010 RepID=UPI000D19BCD3|nr:DNA methyltransferase [Streptomyces sp. MA5143a]SPF04337.1 Type I restriction-modification system methyltransferase subunit [Streptomyces sp. MA5143a]